MSAKGDGAGGVKAAATREPVHEGSHRFAVNGEEGPWVRDPSA